MSDKQKKQNWREYVRRIDPYVPGEQPKERNIVKLNTNENPYPPSKRVEAVLRGLDPASLRLYPDPDASVLISAIAKHSGVDEDEVFAGVGSDDVLAMAFMTFFNSREPLLFPDISYSFYEVWADLFQVPFEKVPLDEEFRIRTSDYKRANGGIIFPNPNAPTGILLSIREIREILDANRDSIVIVDEAYIDFGGESAVPLIREYDNLLVVQTFSKSRSGAGLRIGYAVGSRELIRHMRDVKFSYNSYTLNPLQIMGGAAMIEDEEHFRKCRDRIIATRERSAVRLKEMGFSVLPSAANFLFASHPSLGGEELFRFLKEHGIYVRHWNKERIENYLRITIGTEEEMEQLFRVLALMIKE
ncbi:MAG: histidinol-phosphate transaminase [Lachnospiraceae bacterium]|nr:histidinol-phosphate transaminase [Lachnospiraceae bacterium]